MGPFGCAAWLPAFACGPLADMLLYLVPSGALALLLWIGSSAHPFFFLFTAAGTLSHELAHFSVGLLTNAEPVGLSVLPRRIKRSGKNGGHNWELGSVSFANLRWYNAAPAALAPLLVLGLPFLVAWWRTRHGWVFEPIDLALAIFLAPQFLSFWPSPVDWRLAARSWPWVPILMLAGVAMAFRAELLGIVKG
jgi:hypothetical protein